MVDEAEAPELVRRLHLSLIELKEGAREDEAREEEAREKEAREKEATEKKGSRGKEGDRR